MKKILSALLVVLMLGGLAAFEASAEETNEAYPLVKGVMDIVESGTFYLKGRGSSPFAGNGFPSVIYAMDKDKMMMETEMDWVEMMMAEGGDAEMAKAQGEVLQTALGSKFRMIFMDMGEPAHFWDTWPSWAQWILRYLLLGWLWMPPPEPGISVYWAFPEKKVYLDIGTLTGDTTFDMGSIFEQLFGVWGSAALPEDIPGVKVTIDGKEYLRAALEDERSRDAMYYYFLDGELKRIEVLDDISGEAMVMEIDAFHSQPDAGLFSISGYRALPLAEMIRFFGGLNGIL